MTRSVSQIHGFNGVLKAGEMALVLGRPGSGCTTFLKTLANLREGFAGIDGDVFYGDMTAAEARKVCACRNFPYTAFSINSTAAVLSPNSILAKSSSTPKTTSIIPNSQ